MASVIFQQIHWAPPVKVRQDIGTDLITFARDNTASDASALAHDLGAPVFMQVKGSKTKYLKPSDHHNGEAGWWFAESSTYHFDHWLSFGLPYLLVLVDTNKQVAYWAEVNGRAIEPTGKGRKIFVPVTQRVDPDNADALNKIAVARRKNTLEGAALRDHLNELGPADRLRYALVMPRLIAPRPNPEWKALTFEEAVALLMRNRVSELVPWPEHLGQWPKPEEWATHREWGWRFVGALHELLTTGASAQFSKLAEVARHRFERDACIIVGACMAYTSDQAATAAAMLKPSRYTKPADMGWLKTQLAALLAELEKPKEASKAAQKALAAMRTLDGDATVSAIRGAAAAVLYSTAGLGNRDYGDAITAQDNTGSWWRAQDVSRALEKDLKFRFETWSESTMMHFMASTSNSELSIAAWNAAFTGAWGSWRHISLMNAQVAFTSNADPTQWKEALARLVFIGEANATKAAARKMWMDGPVEQLTKVVTTVAEGNWSKRNEGGVMAVLAAAGDLLEAEAADRVVHRVLDTVNVDGEIRIHGRAWSDRWSEAGPTLNRVLQAGTPKSHEVCADLIIERFSECRDSVAVALIRAAEGIAISNLDSSRLTMLFEVARSRSDQYGLSLLEVIGP